MLQWAQANSATYKTAINYAKHGPPPVVPVPPMIDPPCHSCDAAGTQTQGEAQVAAWVQQSMNPELNYIIALLKIEKQVILYDAKMDKLSAAAQHALNQFSETDIDYCNKRLANRLLQGKAIALGNKYDSEPKQAYAGIQFMLKVGHEMGVVLESEASDPDQDQLIQLSKAWVQSISKAIDTDIFKGYKFNLCPVYADIFREVEMLGGPETDVPAYLAAISKMDGFLNFEVSMYLHMTATDKDGDLDVSWLMTTNLHLKIDWANGCYSPEFQPNNMAVTVTSFTMKSSKGAAALTSPWSFSAPIGTPTLTLCDPNPILLIPFNGVPPDDQITVDGHATKTSFFGGALSGVVTLNALTAPKAEAITGNTSGNSSKPSTNTSNSAAQQMAATQAQIQAHKGDVNWIMSAQGQAAIAALQTEAIAMAHAKLQQVSIPAANAPNITKMVATLQGSRLNWTNGTQQVVNQTFKADKDAFHETLTINVQQAPK